MSRYTGSLSDVVGGISAVAFPMYVADSSLRRRRGMEPRRSPLALLAVLAITIRVAEVYREQRMTPDDAQALLVAESNSKISSMVDAIAQGVFGLRRA